MRSGAALCCLSALLLTVSSVVTLSARDGLSSELRALADACQSDYLIGDAYRLSSSLTRFRLRMDTDSTAHTDGNSEECRALYFKFLSNLDYLQADYDAAVSHIDEAIKFANHLHSDNESYVYVDKAQYQFMLQDFEGAAASLLKAINKGSDNLYAEYSSAYALSLAYCGAFDQADAVLKDTASFIDCLDAFQREELDRRNAKIKILKAEAKTGPTADDYREAKSVYEKYFRHRKAEITGRFSLMTASEREGFWLTQRQFIVDCYRFEEFAPGLVYDAALFNKNLLLQFSARNSKFRSYEWEDVRRGLRRGSAAIEFIQYRRGSSVHLGAAVVTRGCKSPEFIHIGRTDELLGHILGNGMPVRTAITMDRRDAKKYLYTDNGLMEIIWNEELRKAVGGCSDVYFSADGFLHQLAIEYLYPGEDIPHFHRLTSTRSVCKGCTPVKVEDAAALICGDIDFQIRLQDTTDVQNDRTAYDNLTKKRISIHNLDGSRSEVDSIRSIRRECGDSVMTRMKATEQAFRQTAGEYEIVHLSTHGYYDGHLEVPVEDMAPHKTDNTLSQSVLFFSGANANLHDDSFSPDGRSDGIVSARELSELDLSGVSLCVLAACQTGLGDVTGDGVYGIQRGLKNAGAGAMVLSLWSVNDKATAFMMTRLYKHIRDGEDIHTAFHHSRDDLLKTQDTTIKKFDASVLTHRESKGRICYDDPFFRCAFILIDDIK